MNPLEQIYTILTTLFPDTITVGSHSRSKDSTTEIFISNIRDDQQYTNESMEEYSISDNLIASTFINGKSNIRRGDSIIKAQSDLEIDIRKRIRTFNPTRYTYNGITFNINDIKVNNIWFTEDDTKTIIYQIELDVYYNINY